MMVFKNPGLIDLAAATTLGVSVKQPGSFGWFGTGFKFALATILRDGGAVTLWRGSKPHDFVATEEVIRGETFRRVHMDGKPLGFTDQLGRDWEPWMALRELVCNARDEGGDVHQYDAETRPEVLYEDDHTVIVVAWDKLEVAWEDRAELFCEDDPLLIVEGKLRVLPGPASHMYYRGVRARKLSKPSAFRYDVLEAQLLTEDRTIAVPYYADALVAQTLLTCAREDILAAAITAGEKSYESDLDFGDRDEPSRAFLDAVLDARERKDKKLLPNAYAVLQRHQRKASGEVATYTSYRGAQDNLSVAADALQELGLDDIQDQVVIIVDELHGEALSLLEGGRIYLLRRLLRSPPRKIAQELLARYVELNCYSVDDALELLGPILLNQHEKLAQVNEEAGDEPV